MDYNPHKHRRVSKCQQRQQTEVQKNVRRPNRQRECFLLQSTRRLTLTVRLWFQFWGSGFAQRDENNTDAPFAPNAENGKRQ